MKKIILHNLLILVFYSSGFSQGFLKTDTKRIINDNGDEIILRGIGLGGWMLQEGYMMHTSPFANSQHELKAKITELVGEDGAESFYNSWLENHCRKIDIDSLAVWGFNSIRLPMHYNLFTLPIEQEPIPGENTWSDKGFQLTDSLLSWCESNNMYLILDLHATPGGQGYESSISDYNPTKPSLWESAENRNKTIALWRKLAERYADEPWIGGYDLINETNWNLPGNTMLKNIYMEITNAIRQVDTTHIIFIEGNWFANDFTGLTPPWDDNMVYSFHKYWSYNDQASIQWVIDLRNNYNVPIWCGEAGENSNVWFTDAIRLLEDNNIGWAWWPLKKIESISGPLAIKKTTGYQDLLDYWNGSGSQPSQQDALNALIELTENVKYENCEYHKDVTDAMIRQTQSNATIPFKNHQIPDRIFAIDYDLGSNEYAYYDSDIADYHVSTGNYTSWNNGWSYRNDGVDVQKISDNKGANYVVGWIEDGEWLKYTVNVLASGIYNITLRTASPYETGRISIYMDEESVSNLIQIPSTGSWENFTTISIGEFEFKNGIHELKLYFDKGSFNLSQLKFNLKEAQGLSKIDKDIYIGINYPNPFNSRMTLPLLIINSVPLKVKIFNSAGRLIRTLIDHKVSPGLKNITWDGVDSNNNMVASGVYYFQVLTRQSVKIKKVLFVK